MNRRILKNSAAEMKLRDAGTKALAYSGMTIPTIVSLSYFNYAVSAVWEASLHWPA